MKTTNITDLRANLSRILDGVRQGEEVEVLDRGVPVARLVPVAPTTAASKGRVPPWLGRLRRSGAVRVGTLAPVAEVLRGFPAGARPIGNEAVESILDERRAGR